MCLQLGGITADAFRHRSAAEPSRAHHALADIDGGGGNWPPNVPVKPRNSEVVCDRNSSDIGVKNVSAHEILTDFRLCHHGRVSLFISPVKKYSDVPVSKIIVFPS